MPHPLSKHPNSVVHNPKTNSRIPNKYGNNLNMFKSIINKYPNKQVVLLEFQSSNRIKDYTCIMFPTTAPQCSHLKTNGNKEQGKSIAWFKCPVKYRKLITCVGEELNVQFKDKKSKSNVMTHQSCLCNQLYNILSTYAPIQGDY